MYKEDENEKLSIEDKILFTITNVFPFYLEKKKAILIVHIQEYSKLTATMRPSYEFNLDVLWENYEP